MIRCHVTQKWLSQVGAEGVICLCPVGVSAEQPPLSHVTDLYGSLPRLLDQRAFSGGVDETITATGDRNGEPVHIIINGLGSGATPEDALEFMRRAMANAMRQAERLKITNLAIEVPSPRLLDAPLHRVVQELLVSAEMAQYHFDVFITDESRRLPQQYTLTLSAHEHDHEEVRAGINAGQYIGYAVNKARHWSDLPPSHLTPRVLADHASSMADTHDGLSCRVYDQDEINEMGMGGIMAVTRGSAQDARFITMEYNCDSSDAPTLCLVGKGVTFDSGGLSLKPPWAMEDMKNDMAGGSSVLATMYALAYLKPRVNVRAFVPLAENLTGCNAMKPGDVVSFYNGKTAEIRNTDAEGRLLLADALSFACAHYEFDAIVDIATLTGACLHALGPFYAGLLSSHNDLATRLLDAGKSSGDRLWMLPLDPDYRKSIYSEVADVRNTEISKYKAGTIAAAHFLHTFVDDRPWAHIDIAGTGWNIPDRSYYRGEGATGYGVRAFLHLISAWQS